MWFTVELFGVTVFAIGVGPRRRSQQWISNTAGDFELAPQETEEYEYEEEDRFGFH